MPVWRKPFDADTIAIPRGDIHILPDRCKGCGFCVEYCPRSVLSLSAGYNAKGYHPPEVVKPEGCVDCRLCEMLCPDFAIFVTLKNGTGAKDLPAPGLPEGGRRAS